jgi:hypothetical protein
MMDFALALFPWAIVMKLRMRNYEKIGLALTMSLGMLYVPPLPPAIFRKLCVKLAIILINRPIY